MSELARRAFGVTGEPIELPGGASGVFRYHDVVLKPVTDIAEAEWEQATFAALAPRDNVRWARPIAADDGRWVVDGWIANEFIPDLAPVAPDWAAVIEYGARFHLATESIEPPTEMLRARSHVGRAVNVTRSTKSRSRSRRRSPPSTRASPGGVSPIRAPIRSCTWTSAAMCSSIPGESP